MVDSASVNVIFVSVACAVIVVVLVLIVVVCCKRRNLTKNKNTRCSTNKETQQTPQLEEQHMFSLANDVCDV